jgi:glutamyl-tRNA synthetase
MLHVGNARTALFDWLFARSTGGVSLLRIEDTDSSRDHPEWVDVIYRSLEWLGLDWDGDPKFQSAAAEQHRHAAQVLLETGHAYFCDCSPEAVEARKKAAGTKTPGYDSFCANRGLGPGEGRALRFRVPDEGTITRTDVIRGVSEIELATIEDFVIVRGNGVPLYVLANAIDDIEDEITHVLRGEDHLPNVPKQILIRQALGHGEPVWAHLPMIVNDKRKKLSKRRDKVALESYRAEGILPEAMRNYLGTLGWAPPGDQEIVPIEKMIETFRLEDVNSAPAAFDEKKLRAFNGHYIRELPRDEFIRRATDWYRETIVEPMAPVIQERGNTLAETLSMPDFLLHDEPPMDRASWDKAMRPPAAAILGAAIDAYAALEDWSADTLHALTEEIAGRFELSLGKAQAPIRVAVTGRSVGPPLFESLVALGRDRTLARLRRALVQLEKD